MAAPANPNVEVAITSKGETKAVYATHLEPMVTLMSAAFADDPAMRYLLLPSFASEAKRLDYLPVWFRSAFRAAAINNGIFEEANTWSCGAIWMPPRNRADSIWSYLSPSVGFPAMLIRLGFSGINRMVGDFGKQSDAVKERGLGKDVVKKGEYWYLWFIGTLLEERKKGLSSAMIRRYQEFAKRDSLPIWLEATSEQSKRLYLSLGFEAVEEFRIGKGKAAEDGSLEKGGPGVLITAMIWPPRQQS